MKKQNYINKFMQNKYNSRQLIMMAASIFFMAACSGNPPAWWDPSGVYSRPTNAPVQQGRPDVTTSQPSEQEMPAEETFQVTQTGEYEELSLSPLSTEQKEDTSADEQTTAQQLAEQPED